VCGILNKFIVEPKKLFFVFLLNTGAAGNLGAGFFFYLAQLYDKKFLPTSVNSSLRKPRTISFFGLQTHVMWSSTVLQNGVRFKLIFFINGCPISCPK